MVTSTIRDREVNQQLKLHISYMDQPVVPAIFNYLIVAKNVDRTELKLRCGLDSRLASNKCTKNGRF